MLQVSCDPSADLALLRQLELRGLVELWIVSIEQGKYTSRVAPEHKEPPIGVWGGKLAKWGESIWADDGSAYEEIQRIVGRQHHADILHLVGYIRRGGDIFATSDTDFLNHREELEQTLGVKVMTAEQISQLVGSEENGF